MPAFAVKDFVAVSRESFSEGIKSAVEEAKRCFGERLESVEIGPPWNVVLTSDGSVEFRNVVRVIYRSD